MPETELWKKNKSTAQIPWWSDLPEDLQGLVEAKGWSGPLEVIKSYQHLEKLLGGRDLNGNGKTVLLPQNEEDTEGYELIYKALGRPDRATDYNLADLIEEKEVNQAFLNEVSNHLHKLGLSNRQAQGLVLAYQQLTKQHQRQMSQLQEDDLESLRAELGNSFNRQIDCAKRAVRHFEFDQETLNNLENAVGSGVLIKYLAKIGGSLVEDRKIDGSSSQNFNLSPNGAKYKVDELLGDSGFRERYLNGDSQALEKVAKLLEISING